MDHNFVEKAFKDWCEEHGDKFNSDPVQFIRADEPEHYDVSSPKTNLDRPGFSVEVAFEVAQATLRESGAIVDCVITHLKEYGPQMPCYIMIGANLVDMNYRRDELAQLIFTVVFDYYIAD